MKPHRHALRALAGLTIAAELAVGTPAPTGIVEGSIKAAIQRGAELADEKPADAAAQPQPKRTLTILSKAGTQVAQVESDEQGKFRAVLPPGDYLLKLEDARKVRVDLRSEPRPFAVVAGQTVRVDLEVPPDITVM